MGLYAILSNLPNFNIILWLSSQPPSSSFFFPYTIPPSHRKKVSFIKMNEKNSYGIHIQ